MNVRVENPKQNGPKTVTQMVALNLIVRRQAEATITEGNRVVSIRLIDVEARQDIRKRSERGYDKEAQQGSRISRREAKRVPFAGDIGKLGI